jgi:hypothetical protein
MATYAAGRVKETIEDAKAQIARLDSAFQAKVKFKGLLDRSLETIAIAK